jgi:hypothetical protein
MFDTYRVLPHRDVRFVSRNPDYTPRYEHRPCSQELTERDVKEANWCPHCPQVINKAAERRARLDRAENCS